MGIYLFIYFACVLFYIPIQYLLRAKFIYTYKLNSVFMQKKKKCIYESI